MKLFDAIRGIIAAYYWAAYSLHHAVCLRPGLPLKNTRLVVIGSFRAGGAGKTPFCLWLAKRLTARKKRVAILCHEKAFDEILMYKNNLQEQIQQGLVKVIATDNRYKSARELDPTAPDFILCDDGFEDSRLRPQVIFRLDWEKAPTEIDQLIPAGKFRSLRQDHLKDEGRTFPLRCFGTSPDLRFHIESISNSLGNFPNHKQSIAVCGLGDPKRFLQDLRHAELAPQKIVACPDHDHHFEKKVSEILRKHCQADIIVSEKDSCRLSREILDNPRLFIARQSIQVYDQTRAQIDKALT